MFWLGLFIGMLAGGTFGAMMLAVCMMAKDHTIEPS